MSNPVLPARVFLAALAVLLLAGCNQSAPPSASMGGSPATEPARASLVTPAGFRLPEGTGCQGEIARFQAVQANDLQTGHVNRTVYERIRADITQAEGLCAAGNDGGARASLRATKSRYGYPN